MIHVEPMKLEEHVVLGITVKLPKTNLIVITTEKGYIMCGALDVDLLNEKLKDRNVIAGRAIGVRSLEDLFEAPLELVTYGAEALGIQKGMKGKDALLKMI
jgi:uncharacterized protein YunC (DUF1805 family)